MATAKDSALAVKELWIAEKNRDRGPRLFAGHPQSGVACAAASSLLLAELEVFTVLLICSIGFLVLFFCK